MILHKLALLLLIPDGLKAAGTLTQLVAEGIAATIGHTTQQLGHRWAEAAHQQFGQPHPSFLQFQLETDRILSTVARDANAREIATQLIEYDTYV